MKTHKKTTIWLALALCILCAVGLCACPATETPTPDDPEPTPAPTSYTVTYDPANGKSTFGAVVAAGGQATEPAAPEREGYTFRFWSADGTTPFDFTAPVTADLRLTAVWAEAEPPAPETVRIRWEGDEVADFVFDGTTPRTAAVGDVLRFRVRVSPYYTGEPVVSAGSVTATRAEDGTYFFTVTQAVTVRISGLRRDTTPIRGMGTERSPYLIETASQLKTVTDSINGGDEKYRTAHLRLTADLDMAGAAIDPIGGASCQFAGTFDGAGHTVKNFRFREGYGAVGFFGYIAQGVVKDLHLSADLSVLCANATYNYIIGPVVAYCISGDVVNCSFDGSLAVQFDVAGENVAYVGGIVGFLQGYGTDYIGTVSFSSVRADITSVGQVSVTGMGGIVGAAYGTSDMAPACIYNSTFSGRILGRSERSGGIVGYLRTRASVANCLTDGTVEARYTDGVAACGAIVGAADNETALTACASSATLNAVGAAPEKGTDVGDLVGIRYARAYNGIDSRKTVLLGCYYAPDGRVTVGGRTYSLSVWRDCADLLGWRAAEWTADDKGLLPDVTGYEGDAFEEFSVRFVFGRDITLPGPDGNPLTQTADDARFSGYGPLYWVYGGSGMNNFKADDGTISYGYFADEACTVRLPACTMLTGDATVYVGFADYGAMAGEYYTVIGDREIRLTFDDNGKMTMYTNGILANYVYVYDGEKLLLREAYFACFAYPDLMRTYDLEVDYYAVPTADGLRIYDTVFFTEERGTTLTAVKKTDAMGDWYTAAGDGWTFRADGTGTAPDGAFTYTLAGRALTITKGGANIYLTLSEDGQTMESADRSLSLSRRDAYFGTWESAFNAPRSLSADGAGKLTLGGVSYDYTLDENGNLTFSGGQAYFDQNGLLVLVEDGRRTTFGRRGSYIGYWKETCLGYDMELDGIGREGYGIGRDSNGVTFTYVASDTEGGFDVSLYYRTDLYGMFSLTRSKYDDSELLDMAAYTASSGMLVNDYFMCYVDPMEGTWHTSDGRTYVFNGLGAYCIDFHSKDIDWVAIGEVTVTEADGTAATVRYHYDRQTGIATFTYGTDSLTAALRDGEIYIGTEQAHAPDGLQDYIFCTMDGSVRYAFNGKSAAGKGIATATAVATGTETTFRYTVEENEDGTLVILWTSETMAMRIRVTDTRISVLDGSGNEQTQLKLWHNLCGRTYLAAGGSTVTLPAMLNANGTADGTFADLTVTFLRTDPNYLAIYYEGEFLYYIGYHTEQTAVLLDSNLKVVGVLAVDDGFAGTYTAQDGSTLTLDGRSAASEYVFAIATLSRPTEEGTETETLIYLEEDGVYYLCELDRSGDEDVPVKRYRLSDTAEDGATAYTTESGRTVYLVEV